MKALSPSQQEGLQQILQLMGLYNLSASDVKRAAADEKKQKKEREAPQSKSELILRLFTYIGGALIFAGLGIFINTIWEDIGSLPRVIITFGTGFMAYICGLVFASDQRFAKVATPAFILAFLMQPTGLFVLLKEYFDGDDAALGSMFVFTPLALQQGLTFLKLRMPSLLLFTLLYVIGFAMGFIDYFDLHQGMSALVFGLFLLLITIDLQLKEKFKDLTPIFFVISTLIFLSGVYYFIGRTAFDSIALSIILSMLGFAVLRESKTLYVLSLLYLAGYFYGGPGGGWTSGWNDYSQIAAIFTGSSLLLAGHWLSTRTNYISLAPIWMFAGTGYALAGVYGLLKDSALEPAFIIVAGLAVYGALMLRSRAVLAAAIISLISFIVTYMNIHFPDTLGGPIGLIFVGIIVLAAGFVFAKLAGRIKASA